MRNVGHNKNVRKRSTEAKVELKQALVIGFDACLVDSLKSEATVGPLAICVCGGNGTDVNTRVDHEAFSGVTLMNVKHAAYSKITRRRCRNYCLVSPFPEKEQGERHRLAFFPKVWWYQHGPDVLSWRLGCVRDRDLGFR